MPIEIRELTIKATVNENSSFGGSPATRSNASNEKETEVNVIIEKVLAILKEKAER